MLVVFSGDLFEENRNPFLILAIIGIEFGRTVGDPEEDD